MVPLDEFDLWLAGPLRTTWAAGRPHDAAEAQQWQMLARSAFKGGDQHRLDDPRERVSVFGGPLDNVVLPPRTRTCNCANWPAAFRHPDGTVYRLSCVAVVEDEV